MANTVTLKDVAARAGISIATASHVLNGTRKVSAETRDRVLAAIAELGYAGHSIARSLRRGRTATLGLVVSDIENPYFAVLAANVQRAAAQHGYQLVFCNSEEDGAREREIVDALTAQRVEGIILAPVSYQNTALLMTRRTPLVLVNRHFQDLAVPHVVVDDRAGASLGFDHLWNLGHRSIAIVHGGLEHSTSVERIAGVRDSYARRRLPFDDGLLIEAGRSGDKGEAAIVKLFARRLRPTAILALSSWSVLAAIRGLQTGRLRCPEDVSLVGYGVKTPYWMPSWSISMIEQPVPEMAEAAVRLCLEQIESPGQANSVVVEAILSLGQSVTKITVKRRAPARKMALEARQND